MSQIIIERRGAVALCLMTEINEGRRDIRDC